MAANTQQPAQVVKRAWTASWSGAVKWSAATVLAALANVSIAQAQPAPTPPAPQAQACDPPFAAPASLQGRVAAICGIQAPEDLEALPDGRHLIISETRGMRDRPGRLGILDMASGLRSDLPRKRDGGPLWGDSACTDPGADAPFSPHGIHLARRADGALQLLVVDHAAREAIDFFEIRRIDGHYVADWRGCVRNPGLGMFNDVSARPGGGFVATVMFDSTELTDAAGHRRPDGMTHVLSGADTGYLVTWAPDRPFRRLPHSEAPFNNGVQVSADDRFAYFAAWTGRQLRTYDLRAERVVATVPLDFLPDNLSISPRGGFIATGITDVVAWQKCYEQHIAFCPSGFRIASWTPGDPVATTLFAGEPGMIAGASIAILSGHTLYVGSYSGDRLLKIALRKP